MSPSWFLLLWLAGQSRPILVQIGYSSKAECQLAAEGFNTAVLRHRCVSVVELIKMGVKP